MALEPRLCKRNHYVAGWNAVDMGNYLGCLLCRNLNTRQVKARKTGRPVPLTCPPVSLKKTRRQEIASRKARGVVLYQNKATYDLYDDWLCLKEQGYSVTQAQERLGVSATTIYKAIHKYGPPA